MIPALYFYVILSISVTCLGVCIYILFKNSQNLNKIEDVEKKMDVLIRITAQHDIFIDNLKQKQAELMNRKRSIR